MAKKSVENLSFPIGVPGWRTGLPGILLTVTAFLLPLKWGTLATATEAAGFFPVDVTAYLTITWPAHSFGVWSAFLLLMTMSVLPCRRWELRSPGMVTVLLWSVALTAAVLPGCLAAGRDVDFAWGELANTAGVAAWVLALGILQSVDPRWLKRSAAAFMTGVIIAACYGYYQYFFGFAELKAFLENQQADGINVPEAIRLKMADTRVTSFLASPNALAGVILITVPMVFYFSKKWGMMFEPVRLSVPLFLVSGLAVLGGSLMLSRSRSTVLVLVAAAVVAVFSTPVLKVRTKITGGILALLLLAGAAWFAVRCGRGFGSMAERADYLRTSAVLVSEHPFAGAGWGGFFYRHMNIKLSATDEAARDPHNVVAAFAGQSGVFAGLLVLAALLYPLAVLWKHRFDRSWQCAVFWSGMFFTLHILMDCDFHIPAIMAGILLLYLSAMPEVSGGEMRNGRLFIPVLAGFVIIAAVSNIYFLYGEKKLAEFTDYLNPGDVETRTRMTGLPMEKFESAAAAARPNLALIPELAGDWFYANREWEKAHRRYLKSLLLNPRRPGIYRRLARLACSRGDFASGEKLLHKANRLFPRNPKYSFIHPENRSMFPENYKFTFTEL